jgi:FkbM family methyltransferase
VKTEGIKDRILEISSIARRVYGIKLILTVGLSDSSRWFLLNKEKLKYSMELECKGLVLDIGAFSGQYSEKIRKRNPKMTFWLYEPIPDYYELCTNRFKNRDNVFVFPYAISANGRELQMQINGLRTRQNTFPINVGVPIPSMSIQEIFDSVSEIELLKMNIEGMEYECLEQLISTSSLHKAKHILIQFHDFESNSQDRRDAIHGQLMQNFYNVYKSDWMWELWARKVN